MRHHIEDELQVYGLDQDTIDRLVLATAEACNNAITHSACASYVVTVDVDEDFCTIVVLDDGVGFDVPDRFEMPEPHEVSRRGLAIMNALVDDVEVTSNGAGTCVVLRHPLRARIAQSVTLS